MENKNLIEEKVKIKLKNLDSFFFIFNLKFCFFSFFYYSNKIKNIKKKKKVEEIHYKHMLL